MDSRVSPLKTSARWPNRWRREPNRGGMVVSTVPHSAWEKPNATPANKDIENI